MPAEAGGASHVVVIGGGLAGLAAALDLSEAGQQVTLLEARARLGGATASFTRDGITFDTGQHVFLRCCTAYRGFISRLGVEHLTELQPRLDVPVMHGNGNNVRVSHLRRSRLPLPPPTHLTGGLLRYDAMPLRDRLRSVPAVLALARLNQLDPAVDAQSFGSWLTKHGQREQSRSALWGLLTVATLNAELDDASLTLAAKVVRTGLLETADGADIGYSRVPLGRLHGEAGHDKLQSLGAAIQTGFRVRSAHQEGDNWHVKSDDGSVTADAVVLAVPPKDAAALAPVGSGLDQTKLRGLGSSPIVNVHVFYDRHIMDEPFLAAVGSPVQWVFDRTAASGVTSGQYLAISLSAAHKWLSMTTAELQKIFVDELARLLPEASPERVTRVLVTREPHATFDQGPGQLARRPENRTALAGLVVAGAWTQTGWPATMEGAVRSGQAAASELLARSPSIAVSS
jgi:squalene-associated FAD-dependent desaturase